MTKTFQRNQSELVKNSLDTGTLEHLRNPHTAHTTREESRWD